MAAAFLFVALFVVVALAGLETIVIVVLVCWSLLSVEILLYFRPSRQSSFFSSFSFHSRARSFRLVCKHQNSFC